MYSKRVILGNPEGSPEGFVCEIDKGTPEETVSGDRPDTPERSG
jgi:hypothetical protein